MNIKMNNKILKISFMSIMLVLVSLMLSNKQSTVDASFNQVNTENTNAVFQTQLVGSNNKSARIIGTRPIISIMSPIVTQKGDIYDPLSRIVISDAEDPVSDLVLTYTGSVDTNVAGLYNLVYTLTDTDSNSTTVTRTVVVQDETIVIKLNHAIMAKPFSIATSKVDDSVEAIRTGAGIVVYDLTNGRPATNQGIVITKTDPAYINGVGIGEYQLNVTSDVEPNATIDFKITVVADMAPVITTPGFTELNLNDSFDIYDGVSANDAEDGNLPVTSTGLVDTSKIGVYKIVYTAVDSGNASTSVTRIVIVNDSNSIVYNDNYIIKATNYNILKSELTDELLLDSNILTNANVKLYDRITGEQLETNLIKIAKPTLSINSNIGPHKITFSSNTNPSVLINRIINVLGKNTVIGGIEEGLNANNNTAINANNFKISTNELSNLTDEKVIKLSNAYAWNLQNGTPIQFSVDYSKIKNEVGIYQVEFTTNDNVKIIIDVEVIKGIDLPISENNLLPETGSYFDILVPITMFILSGSILLIIRKTNY